MRNSRRSGGAPRPVGTAGIVGLWLLGASFPAAAWAQEPGPPPAEGTPQPGTVAPPPQAEAAPPAGQAEPAPPESGSDPRALPPPPPRGYQQGGAPQAQGSPYGYGYQPSYGAQGQSYMPPPLPRGVFRPFSFGVGAGPGVLSLRGDNSQTERGISYMVRFGFGVEPNLSVTVAFEGAAATSNGTLASQDALLLGVQYFVSQVLYLRGGVGIANETERDPDTDVVFVDQNGFALQGGVGVDLIQSASVSLGLEASALLGQYPDETWIGGGLNLVFSIY
ncbi:MAG: hypothetical protein KA712_02810 [Myxococcales bacterium]|nr:hypothetical protein [Myxococcales bacterium]